MPLSEILLPEFDEESAVTRKTLERIPADKLDWQPHPKSMTMRRLASHLGNIPMWGVMTIEKDSLDLAPQGGEPQDDPPGESVEQILANFDARTAAMRAAIAGASDEHLAKPWTLCIGGHQLFSLPRQAVLRRMVMNHAVHHRAQLGVYLRLNGVAVPGPYGPSADDAQNFHPQSS